MKVPSPHSPPGNRSAEPQVGAIPQAPASPVTTTEVSLPCMDEGTLERLSGSKIPSEPPERTQSVSVMPTAPAVPRLPYLVILTGAHEGKVIKLPRVGNFTIGRAETCDLVLDDDGISRTHARVSVGTSGVFVEDLDSRNGTFIGPQNIKRQRLLGDEIIRVGSRTVFKFSLMDGVEEDYLKRLLSAALKDPLTSLYNRRHFDERLATACAAATRHGEVFSLVVIDIDNFKHVNDTYGHAVGDVALKTVADIMTLGARREDEAFRYGGEEFAILMRSTPAKGALEVSERRRKSVEDVLIQYDGVTLKVTASFGVTEYRAGDTELSMFERADKALYEAKHSGKNRVVVAK